MKRVREFFYRLSPYLLITIGGALTVAQIISAFLLYRSGSAVREWAGWICLWTAGVFGVLPILTLRRGGKVPRGKSYMHTTVLVDSGIYALVRHPQGGVAGLLINLGVMVIVPHWLTVALGVVSMGLTYVDTFKEDARCIEKFGDSYRQYMGRVPRVNFVAGFVRLLRRGREVVEG
jgi:protein-S-isoprenylcysteine O-methyltransferase Ste14